METLMYLDNVGPLRRDEEKCIGCGMCLEVAPRAVLPEEVRARTSNRDACIVCAPCTGIVPWNPLPSRRGRSAHR
jgi:ferredoxin